MAIYYGDGSNSATGRTVQTVQYIYTTSLSATSNDGYKSMLTGAYIQPKNADSKILVMYSVNTGATEGGYNGAINLFRDSTQIYLGDAASNRARVSNLISISNTGGGTDYNMVHLSGHHLDSPSTTSATTYKLQLKNLSSESLYINQSKNDGDQTYIARTASSITVMEISG